MPSETPAAFLIEPFISADTLALGADAEGRPILKHTAVNSFLQVTLSVFGLEGEMHALTPTALVGEHAMRTFSDKYGTGATSSVTPIPPELASADVVEVRRSPGFHRGALVTGARRRALCPCKEGGERAR